jgi:uncharacterized protein (DUF58 family)
MSSIHIKREGRRFLIAVALIGFASFNTGNNLIYLIFSLMFSISLISLLLAMLNLKGLKVRLSFKEPLYAETPLNLEVELENSKPVPSYSLSIILPFNEGQKLYLPSIRSGLNRKGFEGIVVRKRGRYHIRELRLMTGFPFIFMHLYRRLGYDAEVIIYPKILDILPLIKDILPSPSETGRPRMEQEGEFLFAREYVYGEESKRIDWKATARMQKTMMKVFSKGDERLATIILDNGGGGREDVFEKAVSVSASLCSEFIQRGYFVRLITCRKIVPFGKGRTHLFKILDILAGIKQMGISKCPVEELSEGLNIAVLCSDSSGFSEIISQCSGVIDARNL